MGTCFYGTASEINMTQKKKTQIQLNYDMENNQTIKVEHSGKLQIKNQTDIIKLAKVTVFTSLDSDKRACTNIHNSIVKIKKQSIAGES